MNAKTIDLLSAMDPRSKLPMVTVSELNMDMIGKHAGSNLTNPFSIACRERFLSKYTKPNFGFYIAQSLATHRVRFPIPALGRDAWVFKAYLMTLNSDKNFNHHIAEAFHLWQSIREQGDLGNAVKAMLISCPATSTTEEHIAAVAKVMGVSRFTIDAFESLFYNVLERREDALFIAREVYPDSRLVEFDANYQMNASAADIIKRVAYNHRDMDMAAYLLGIGDQAYFKKIAARSDRESELAKYIMGNGLILTHSNLLNQNSVGLSRASTLLAASRQSGTGGSESSLTQIAPLYGGEYLQAVAYSKDIVRMQMRQDAGVVDV